MLDQKMRRRLSGGDFLVLLAILYLTLILSVGEHVVSFKSLSLVVPLLMALVVLAVKLKRKQRELLGNARLASIGEMTVEVGHEINNPLSIAIGNLKNALRTLNEPETNYEVLKRTLERQVDSLKKIEAITGALRGYVRSDSATTECVNVHSLILEVLEGFRAFHLNRKVFVKLELDAQYFFVSGVKGKVEQVLTNLLLNAKDALEKSEKPEIIIQTKNFDEKLIINVSDTGCGISEENCKRVFDSFFSTKPIGRGTGLGLKISSRIIREMKGTISVKSELKRGSTFSVTFPACKPRKINGRVLIVDDDDGIRELLREVLEDLGFSVDEAEDGDLALQKIEAHRYRMVFSDMSMPRMSGESFLREVKLRDRRIKTFVVSGSTNLCLKHADGYVLKPFSLESIYEMINNSLRNEKIA